VSVTEPASPPQAAAQSGSADRPRRNRATSAWLLAVPVLAFYALFLLAPVVELVQNSVAGDSGSFTLEHYRTFLTDSFYTTVLARTLLIAGCVTVASLVLGYPAAWYLYRGSLVVLCLLSPLLISAMVRTYGWVLVFAPNTGVIAFVPGLGSVDLLYTELAMVVGLVHVILPFMVLPLYASFASMDRNVLLAADSLGASPVRVLRTIVLPLTRAGAVAGMALSFALAATSVSVPILLGGSRNETVPYLIYQQYQVLYDFKFGAAMGIVLLLVTAAVLAAPSVLGRRRATVVRHIGHA
jgi:putative spermidine/putrescine transport system permease protein